MKVPIILAPALVLALSPLVVATAAGAADGGRPFVVELTGEAEVPGPGDPDGSGTATLRVNPGQQEICYSIEVTDIQPATVAHIHEADADSAGPIVVSLEAPTSGLSSGCADVDRALARDILRSPDEYYVNVHNTEFPAGALRGQLG